VVGKELKEKTFRRRWARASRFPVKGMLAVPRPRDATSEFVKDLVRSLSLVLLLLSSTSYSFGGKSERGTVLSHSNNTNGYPNPGLFGNWIGVVSVAQRSSSPTSAGTVVGPTVSFTVYQKIMSAQTFNRLVRLGLTFVPSVRAR